MSGIPQIFIGSSSESLAIAHTFQVELERKTPCEVTVWDQGTFLAGEYTMESLWRAIRQSDFAVMVMAEDDITDSRGVTGKVPRDNVIFELGLFMGALGPGRVLMLTPQSRDLRIPSDLSGITRLAPYDPGRENQAAALTAATLGAAKVIKAHGTRMSFSADQPDPKPSLNSELAMIRRSAESQGWRFSGTSETTFRVLSPKNIKFSFAIPEDLAVARTELRAFARKLRAAGLRVNQRVIRDPR